MNGRRQRDRDETLDTAPSPEASYRPHTSRSSPSTAAVWKAEPGAGQLIGIVLFLVAIVVLLISFLQVSATGGVIRIFWLLAVLALTSAAVSIAVLVVRLRSIQYVLEESALVVNSVGRRLVIPYDEMIDVVFRPRDRVDVSGYEWNWPGFYDSQNMTSEGFWRSVATTPPRERVRIRLSRGLTVAISPERPVLFVETLESYRQGSRSPASWRWSTVSEETLDATPRWDAREESIPSPPATPLTQAEPKQEAKEHDWPDRPRAFAMFRERIVRGDPVASNLLALSLIGVIALAFIAGWKSDAVNRPLAVHWNADGDPSWFVRPDGIWIIEGVWIFPLTGAAVIVVNAALATLAAAANRVQETRWLTAASFVVELLLLVAMMRATGIL